MRLLAVIFCFFCLLNNSFGQDTTLTKIDTTKFGSWKEFNNTHHNPLYVIDGLSISDSSSIKVLNGIDSKIIIEIIILKDSASKLMFVDSPPREAVVIITKSFARKEYQKKLSAFSAKYKAYIVNHVNDDRSFVYILNGIPLQGKQNEIITTLYDLSKDSIKKVKFKQEEFPQEINAMVLITTK